MTEKGDANQGSAKSTWSLDLRGTSPGVLVQARQWAREALADLGRDHLADTMLVATELVTNAYDHGGGPREVRMTRSYTPCLISIEVDDSNTDPPVLGRSRHPTGGHGRGLTLVDRLSESWGMTLHSTAGYKTVWARINCDNSPCPNSGS